jgi:thioredoxin-related protein
LYYLSELCIIDLIFFFFFVCDLDLDDKDDNEPQYKMINVNDKVEEPKKLMMFDSLEEVERYYGRYG